jgi:hypothetical protein
MEEFARSGVYKAMPITRSTSPRPRRRKPLLIAIAVTILLLSVGVATAAATASIEGVWSFSGGQINIQPEGTSGKFEGIVVAPTKFAECTHPVEQKIWKEMTLQPDGSYWGFHQWYKSNHEGTCEENPVLGPTAWRVIEEPNGSRGLRVCLSYPGGPQPTIPPGSEGTGATYGCLTSSFTAPTPVVGGSEGGSTGSGTPSSGAGTPTGGSGTAAYKESLSLPSTKKCLSVRLFQIHLLEPTYDPFKTVSVTFKGHKIATTRHGKYVVATINLKNLPHGHFTIKIAVTTVLDHHLSATRTYHTCAKTPKKSKPKNLT